MEVLRDLGYVQFDPMRIVAQSHLLVLWSRLGLYDRADLDRLLWKERRLFQDWAQTTSIVLTEDHPIFSAMKRGFATGNRRWAERIRAWVDKNREARNHILAQLKQKGPLFSDALETKFVEDWRSTGWTAGRNVHVMLTILWAQGEVMIAGREGNRKVWDLTERFLPEWTPREQLPDREVFRRVAQKSLRALGVARAKQIKQHYIRGGCPNINDILAELQVEGCTKRVQIREGDSVWRGPWFIHASDEPLLDRLAAGDWEPRTTLLSPFDNLICDRQRTERLFSFHFRFEVYVPEPKRKYGCYVMAILHGDRLIGRLDPVMNRKRGELTINAVYAEPNAPKSKETARAVANAVEDLGTFLGAKEIFYGQRLPAAWKSELR
ncbi:MAG: YcaQ family DNA glycosylase [Candidatus Bathyarchaeota archaeon]|nr:MAG: YcaQ family DNA glycosylase [Candidatus Bathyarchaeota archaeon]